MCRCEDDLSTACPRSVLTATELLGVVTQIMAYAEHDPKHVFANQSRCLSILRNVREALGWLRDDTPLTHKAYVDTNAAERERQGATLQ
jgi:hypothetical protein